MSRLFKFLISTSFLLGIACNSGIQMDEEYLLGWENWQLDREEWIKERYLKIFLMQELKEGVNRIGSSDSMDIVVPKNDFPDWYGNLILWSDSVVLEKDTVLTTLFNIDRSDTANLDDYSMFIFNELGSTFVRLRDDNNPAVEAHQRPEVFPVNSDLIIPAKYKEDPHSVDTPFNMMGSGVQEYKGYIIFRYEGKRHKLSVKGNWVEFADETNGVSTYGGGRYLQFEPGEEGKFLLDFNFAYSPPCAYSEFTICPLPPASNQLPFSVEAGQKY